MSPRIPFLLFALGIVLTGCHNGHPFGTTEKENENNIWWGEDHDPNASKPDTRLPPAPSHPAPSVAAAEPSPSPSAPQPTSTVDTKAPSPTKTTAPSAAPYAQPAPTVSEPVWKRIQKKGKMVVGVKADTPPFSQSDGSGGFWGFEVDLLNALADEIGFEVEMIPVNAKERAPALLQDKADLVIATMTLTRKREGVVDFSIPYFEVGQGFIAHAETQVEGFQDLDGHRLAVLEGTQTFHTLSRIQPGAQLIIVSSYEEGIQKVISKDVTALCSDHLILLGLFHGHDQQEKLSLLEQTFAPDAYAVAMRENESTLRNHVNEGLMKLWENGTWHDAFDTWFGPGSMYNHELMFRIDLIPE